MKRSILASLLVLGCSVSAFAAPITYYVNHVIGSGSIVGSIETDGTFGVLSTANILDWTLTLSSPNLAGGSPDVITPTGGGHAVAGSALTATGTDLVFDFGAGSDGAFAMQGADGNAWCMVTGPGLSCQGETTPSDGIYFGTTNAWAELANPSGREVIASAVPEPASVALVAIALLGLGLGRRRNA